VALPRTHPQRVLEGARGDIQNDGYAGINPLFVGPDAPRRIGCNDHGRRRFVQALEQGDRRAQPMIDLYGALYHVERTATERNLDATGRLALRQAESVPLWRELERVIIDITPKVDKKAPLGSAAHAIVSATRWKGSRRERRAQRIHWSSLMRASGSLVQSRIRTRASLSR
jgi:hypothetical protein